MPAKSYKDMIIAAIVALKERSGSSSAAIKKHMLANNKGLDFKSHLLSGALKRGVAGKVFNQIKNSYKVVAKPKKVIKKVIKKKVRYI